MEKSFEEILSHRLKHRPDGILDVHSTLRHFALINYALPRERLASHLPLDRFEIPEFIVDGEPCALISAVPFVDADFHFARLFPFLQFEFGQTNFRAYVIDKKSGEHCVWFFGTTLGSPIVAFAKKLWKIPWHQASYKCNFSYDEKEKRYMNYELSIQSKWCNAEIDLEDTGYDIECPAGFSSIMEMQLILTHPIDGYFYRGDGKLGTYSVWHERISFTRGHARNLYFSLFEDLKLLSREEMQRPHSVFICPETEFKVHLPPKSLE